MAIRTPDQRLRVFVSSTLGELADERRAVARAISALRLTPVMFESGARPHPPQELYRAYVAQSDVFIGLYWQRYGWVGPGMRISGLEEELTLARDLPRLLYVKRPAPEREPRLAELLDRVKQDATESYHSFRTPAELSRLVRDDLATLLSDRFAASRPESAAESAPQAAATSGSGLARRGPRPLPVDTTVLVGRERAIDEVAGLLDRPDVRLVTLIGPGGVGKTRLALAVAGRLSGHFDAGTVFAALAMVTRPELVLAGIVRAAGADLPGAGAPLEVLVEHFSDNRWLLVLDNLEQVVEVAGDLADLLTRCAGATILATSRTALGMQAEHEYPVPPLALPGERPMSPEELAAVPAVALFVDRARAVHPGFALTAANAGTVAEICRRLEGLPLAIELAAARTRLLDPDALLGRLTGSLDALGTGAVDMPARQRTLRATVEWSVGILDDAERSLLETTAVFVDGWTIDATADVAALDEDQALDLTEALERHSLIQLDRTDLGPRCRMLETVRVFVAERLAARPDAVQIQRRHADHYRALAEQADRPLRGVGQREWVERLETEAGNLAAAVRWYLAHDPRPLPHLYRILWPFWSQRDHLGEARAWIHRLLPTADSLDPQVRAELLWTVAVTAREMGDDQAALAARDRLAPLLAGIDDPYVHAAVQLSMAWTSPIVGDLGGALREALASLDEFRAQDEALGTASAGLTVGSLETSTGRYDDALRHLTDARDLADRLDNAWLAATSRVLLGILAMASGRQRDARPLLDEGLDLSLAADSTQLVTLCPAAYARLAYAEGSHERAARLAGAAEGLRRRVGLWVWPSHRRPEADLVAQLRQVLGAARFDEVFATGARLNRREALAFARDRHGG
jgi:predicted ATPase